VKALFALLALLALPAFASAPKAKPENVAAYRALAALDGRVATIGYRLAAANAPFCKIKARNPGWVLNGIAQFDDRAAAAEAFGFNRWYVNIVALVAGGPAEKAGLKVGDAMASLPDTRWDQRMHVLPKADAYGMEELRMTMNSLWEKYGFIDIQFDQGESRKTLKFAPPAICTSDFWVEPKAKVDAGADGERVRITSGLVGFAANDDQLAAAIAHELAHNILGHPAQLATVKKGKAKAIYATEVEADRLSVWLMTNAGYDAKAALVFIERYGRKYDLGLLGDGTHPGWKRRVASMRDELLAIAAMQPNDGLRDPPLLSVYRNQQ
jgi:beta-barrel assembly-enhancing protease